MEKNVNVLQAGQTLAERFVISSRASNLYLTVHYKWNNQEHSLARAVTRRDLPVPPSMWPILLPVLSSLIGATLGAWLVSFFSSKRERSRARFEWSKMLFEKYEKSYREFLRNWGNSISPMVLRTQFETLESTSLVPNSIRDMYDKTLMTLSSDGASDVEKHLASSNLRQTVARFMEQPWYGQQ
jgi:hypothetical protein